MPHIYSSLQGYPGRWVHLLESGSDLTMTELLERMDCTFGDVHKYDTMIRSLYKIRQKEGESVKEYMLQIHRAVAVIHHAYPDRVTNQGKNLARDQFYHGLSPSLCNTLRFTMVELPKREQVNTSFDMLYMLAKKMEARQPSHPHKSWPGSSDAYRDKYQRYPAPVGWIAMLEEEKLLPPDPELPDSEAPKLDQIEGLSLRITQAMNHY